uniref:Uncharacterized protein n=1 Tax=Timema douglasi TaxID=61478 RepID=A0A7R8ZGA7_TIMDO|nr:unnamed protein product [Timema douglasi]
MKSWMCQCHQADTIRSLTGQMRILTMS